MRPIAPAYQEKVNRIRICMEYPSLKEAFVALDDVNSKECYVSLTRDGFSLSCLTPLQVQGKKGKKASVEASCRAQADYEFYSKDLFYYDYRLVTTEKKIIPSFGFTVKTHDFLLRLKGLKTKKIGMLMEFDSCNICKEIAFSVPGSSSITYLAITIPERNTSYVNQLETWFKGRDPSFRASCTTFQGTIQSAKQNKCDDIEFCINKRTKNFSARCWDKDTMVFSDPMVGDLDTLSYEQDEPDDSFISKHINLTQNGWMDHIHKLCPESIVRIYIKEDPNAPLVLTTYIGHQGQAVHSIPDASREA